MLLIPQLIRSRQLCSLVSKTRNTDDVQKFTVLHSLSDTCTGQYKRFLSLARSVMQVAMKPEVDWFLNYPVTRPLAVIQVAMKSEVNWFYSNDPVTRRLGDTGHHET